MKTLLILIGKTQNRDFDNGIIDYIKRINHYMPLEVKEGSLLLKRLQPSDTLVLLDEHGTEFRSLNFASWLQNKKNTVRRLVFAIGGPYGFDQEVYQRANEKISLSRMTFSHQMVRLVFTEQLYRACTIINGEPYHHE